MAWLAGATRVIVGIFTNFPLSHLQGLLWTNYSVWCFQRIPKNMYSFVDSSIIELTPGYVWTYSNGPSLEVSTMNQDASPYFSDGFLWNVAESNPLLVFNIHWKEGVT